MGKSDLLTKDLLLNVSWSEIVVIIEADFTNSARERLCVHCSPDFARGLPWIGSKLPCRVGVHADREPDVTPPRTDLIRLCQLRLIVGREDHKRTADTLLPCARNDLIQIVGELGASKMTVAVNKHGSGHSALGSGSRYRTREPGGSDGSTATRFGSPPSALPASTIPFDSIPISFAGLRFATMTIVRPTSCSG